jgi:hypothetical protein
LTLGILLREHDGEEIHTGVNDPGLRGRRSWRNGEGFGRKKCEEVVLEGSEYRVGELRIDSADLLVTL